MTFVRICSIPDCSRKHASRGWCGAHYERWKRHGDPLSGGPNQPRYAATPCSAEGCDARAEKRLLCDKHYQRWIKYGDADRLAVRRSLAERFWEHVDKAPGLGPNGDCWEWTAYRQRRGYGVFGVAGNKTALAHRVSYDLAHPESSLGDAFALHRCDNPPCVNPDHLFRGDHAANATDRDQKGRVDRDSRTGRYVSTGGGG